MECRATNVFQKIFSLAVLLAATWTNGFSQPCALTCTGSNNVSLGATCAVQIMPNQILSGPPPCPGSYQLFLTTSGGDTVPGNLITGLYIGQTLTATVWHPSSDNSCWGSILVEDKTAPTLTCPDVSVNCNQSMAPATTGFPKITDNCQSSNFTILPHNDGIMLNGTCQDTFIKRTLRVWTVLDASGNQANCAQMITVVRPKITDIVFPTTPVIIAVGTTADPSKTGQPTLGGKPIDQVACNFLVNMHDDTLPVCYQKGKLVEYKILREWLVLNNCGNGLKKEIQTIVVKDQQAPFLLCPPPTIVSMVLDECFANIASLPLPTVSTPDSVAVSWQFGNGFGPYDSIPAGVYELTYTAYDCSHAVTCKQNITIKDTQTPTPILLPNQVVALSNGGKLDLPATFFNVGSFDNCDGVNFQVSTNGKDFFPKVSFTCADVGFQIMVTVRVCEMFNPTNCTDAMVAVTVQDKLPPVANPNSIPKNITVDCRYDYLNPTLTGATPPIFSDNCGMDTVYLDVENNVNACGEGTVRRVWTAWDVNGNSSKIVQIITVENQQPFTSAGITWPLNFQTNVCGASLSPDALQQPYKEPVIVNKTCSMIAVNFKDQIFNQGNPGCSKIMRKWTVVDWCQYDPNFPNAGGSWTYTQVLQVMDGQAPDLVVPSDVTVSVGNDCLKGLVTLPDATATDCSNLLTISHNSTHAAAPGANISGNYPLGNHTITIKAADGCGNVSQKLVKIAVVDNVPPNAYCLNGISTTIINMGAMGNMVMVGASVFDAGSTDFCTPKNQLKINIKRGNTTDTPTPTLAFNCDDIGLQLVELHVGDAKGNVGKCVTYILVQDNLKLCPTTNPVLKANISGKIETEKGSRVQNVTIDLPNFQNAVPVLTDSTGLFAIPNLPIFGNYDVRPAKDGDDLNGVTSFDILQINRHILGVAPLTSPLQIIAADVNRSGSVTTADVLELRKVLLGVYDSLPNNTSWRFVDKNFVFDDPQNPFKTPFPEVKSIANLNKDTAAQFVGIKIGDTNGSAQANSATSTDDRNDPAEFELLANDQTYEEGDLFAFALKFANRQEVAAMTFTLEFDPEKVGFDDWAPGSLPNLTDANISFWAADKGKITFCWTENAGIETTPDQTILMLQGTARAAGKLSEAIRLGDRPTRREAYGSDGEQMDLSLHFTRPDGSVVPAASAYELYQNRPNPFTGETSIGFHLPASKTVVLSIFDAAGRLVFEQSKAFEKGKNEWVLGANALPQRGVFSYRISTEDWSATKKMVKW